MFITSGLVRFSDYLFFYISGSIFDKPNGPQFADSLLLNPLKK